jgi:hypothetical protein
MGKRGVFVMERNVLEVGKPQNFGKNSQVSFRVARWYIYIPKIPVWGYFGRPRNG